MGVELNLYKNGIRKIEENLVILKGDRLGEYWGNGP